MHVPQLEDSCQSAAVSMEGSEEGAGVAGPEGATLQEKGLLQVTLLPSHPCPPPGLTGRGLTGSVVLYIEDRPR